MMETKQGDANPIAFRLPDILRVAIDAMMQKRGARGVTEYMRGLVILDVLEAGDRPLAQKVLDGVAIPQWATKQAFLLAKRMLLK